MNARSPILLALHAWCYVGAVGVSGLVADPALAGVNHWDGPVLECQDLASFQQATPCMVANADADSPTNGPHTADTPVTTDMVSPYGWTARYRRKNGTLLTAIFQMTDSCATMSPARAFNATYGGCAEICVAPETLNTTTGGCGPPPTEVTEDRSDGNGGVCKGNPCDILSGNKSQLEIDYAPGTGVLAFARTYNSLRYHSAKDGAYGEPLGESWFGSYFQFVSATSGLNSSVVHAVRPNGDVIEFTATAPGFTSTEYEAEGELKERLVVALTSGVFVGWRYITASDDVELYDTNGRLLSIKNRGGVTQTLTYGSNNRLESVADDFGHELTFQWDTASPPRLTTIGLPGTGSGQIVFGYGANNNLTSVTYPDARERHYLYELSSSQQKHLLTGIEDESGVRYATWGYDSTNRVTSSVHAGGADSYSFTYNSDGSRVVVDPLGKSATYTSQLIAGQRRSTGSNSQCKSCGGEHATATYDSAGNFDSTTDFNGVETRYDYDVARTLEVSRTEAYGTPRERTVTTNWHPTFRLPEEINEPGRRTEFTYDANGNLLTQTVTDAATSQSRSWTSTYSTLGSSAHD